MENARTLNLGRFEDIPADGMRAVEVQNKKILLIRHGDTVTAIGAECPHAGAPLVEGVLAAGQVICPWHKAAFCTRTGALLDPPAVDDLPSYAVAVENGDIVLRDIETQPTPAAAEQHDGRHFVVIGAGAAGFSAAQELRKLGFKGAVTLISHEEELPYDRTVLSKYFLSGEQGGEKSPLQNEAFFEDNKIKRLNAEVVKLDPAKQSIVLADGCSLRYDAALIATGGDIIAPPFPGGDLANVFVLRSHQDAERILAIAKTARRAVVIGASFIGMEVAAALTERGLEVTVVDSESAPFERQLGAMVGNVYRRIHEEKAVKFRLGEQVERLTGETTVNAVVLKGGEVLQTDLVVAGLGIKPATSFIAERTRDTDHGLEVDAQLRVEGNLYAAGDVAAFPIYGDGPLTRIEHWRLAEQHGIIAARNMAGGSERFTAVPYFWTIQYKIRLDYVGHASGDDEQVVRGDLSQRKFIVYYIRNGLVSAAAGMNSDQDMAAIIALMNARQLWKVEDLHPTNAAPTDVLRALQ
jgi:NADPH-dependent 2,4-dienoyl-CoA reductase/sulfur reductase-like enzyme/nitrite reductase/ring-hydroxylating ferredoxin subunit